MFQDVSRPVRTSALKNAEVPGVVQTPGRESSTEDLLVETFRFTGLRRVQLGIHGGWHTARSGSPRGCLTTVEEGRAREHVQLSMNRDYPELSKMGVLFFHRKIFLGRFSEVF